MKTTKKSVRYVGNTLVLFGLWLSVLTAQSLAQTINSAAQGDNAVWQNSTTISGSQAFIDASAWCNGNCQGVDFCRVVNEALVALPTHGGVVDARGVVYPNDGHPVCTINPFPQPPNNVPATVLLPPAIIEISGPWILPSNTRISGQGRQTILQAITGFALDSSNAMVEMGSVAGSTNIVVEHLKLDGSLQAACNPNCPPVGVSGVYNGNAQDGSYVDEINLYNIGAVSGQSASTLTAGLFIGPGAAGSGPYSNLNFAGSANCSGLTCTPTACVQIEAQTRGLHGITCSGASNQSTGPMAGIYLDASNNTIEDVHSEAFYDAIVVGDNANATVVGNVISNVTGGYGGAGPTTHTIHICGGVQTGACTSKSGMVSDLAMFQVQSSGGYKNGVTGYHAMTIEDDLTGTTINSSAFPTYVGTYVLGESVGTSQYSRFRSAVFPASGAPRMPIKLQ